MATAVLDGMGDATYEFVTPAAWDGLGMDDGLKGLLRAAVAIDDDDDDDPKPSSDDGSRVFFVMGTIASRIHDDDEDASCTVTSSSTICAVRNEAPDGTVVLDVNLRDPWYEPRRVLELARGRRRGDGDGERRRLALLKLNEEELTTLERWLREEEMEGQQPGIDGEMEGEDRGDATPDDASPSSSSLAGGSDLERRMEGLGRRLNALRVCVTRGRDGAALWCGEDARTDDGGGGTTAFHEHSGYCHLPPPPAAATTAMAVAATAWGPATPSWRPWSTPSWCGASRRSGRWSALAPLGGTSPGDGVPPPTTGMRRRA